MKKLNIIILTLLMFFFGNLNSLTLQLKRTALISNETIKVIDLVESYDGEESEFQKIQNIVIEELPYQRRMINIPSNTIARKIRLSLPELEINITNVITAVRWEETLLDETRITSAAEVFLRDYYLLSEDAEITFTNVPRLNIPSHLTTHDSQLTLTFELSRTTENTNFVRLDGKAYLAGDVIHVFNVLARVQEKQLVYQANRSIRKGQRINTSDFIKVAIATNPNNAFVTEIFEGADIIANNFISKGSYLKNTDVVGTPFVQRNDTVTVMIKSASMQMSYEAVSRADGWLGDRIMLQNPDSRQNFYAVVIDKNKVLINLED